MLRANGHYWRMFTLFTTLFFWRYNNHRSILIYPSHLLDSILYMIVVSVTHFLLLYLCIWIVHRSELHGNVFRHVLMHLSDIQPPSNACSPYCISLIYFTSWVNVSSVSLFFIGQPWFLANIVNTKYLYQCPLNTMKFNEHWFQLIDKYKAISKLPYL